MKMSTNEFYLKTPDEMENLFKFAPQALENTVEIAKRCNVDIDFDTTYLPEFTIPEGVEPYHYLRQLCYSGLERIYGKNYGQEKIERLEYELSIIKQMGYIDYFLIVWDFVKFAKDNNIIVGPGRGSATGSLVTYSLNITTVDPFKYDLVFERFLNPERVSMPDIDIDFCYERRQEVIDYVVEKYGSDRVAQLITFGTMGAKAVIRDVGRVMDIPYSKVDFIAKKIPFQLKMTIDKALEISSDLKELYNTQEDVRELIDVARLLEGMPRHASSHAAGIVITQESVTNYVPVQKGGQGVVTQFPMGTIEEIGLLKMDFLGLRTLTVIQNAVELINERHNLHIDISLIDMEDKKVFKYISKGNTSGIFQLESKGMTEFIKKLKPDSLEDVIAGIALFRPGPMDQIPKYIENKLKPENVTYIHPILKNILQVTYGCIVYQEQVMQIVREMAGYSMGRSDLVRRAMSKKKVDIMEKEKQNFIYGIKDDQGNVIVEGSIARGISEEIAKKVFSEIESFASYAFPKPHAAAYAHVSYQTAWLKYYYPTEFMTAMLNSFITDNEKISQYMFECKEMGIPILPVDINKSMVKFSIEGKSIRFALLAVKNVGVNIVEAIVKDRKENGEFKNFKEFCERLKDYGLNKKNLESLIMSGGFTVLNMKRSVLMSCFEDVYEKVKNVNKNIIEGQISFFDNDLFNVKPIEYDYPELEEYKLEQLLAMEKNMTGCYLSGHPLDRYKEKLKKYVTAYSHEFKYKEVEEDSTDGREMAQPPISNGYGGRTVIVGGVITSKKRITTKKNNLMAVLTLEDFFGSIEVIIFPNLLEKYDEISSGPGIGRYHLQYLRSIP